MTGHQNGHGNGKTSERALNHAVSYPTNCLQFLHNLRTSPQSESHRENASTDHYSNVRLRIMIAGAGLGGLATAIALARRGHSVVVFEQAAQLGEVGAGIQIPANSARLLLRWGIEPYLMKHAVEPEGISFRRWKEGNVIGYTRLIPDFRQNFGAPYYVIHRAHFHDAMCKLALSLGVEIKVNSKVVDYDIEAPSLTLANGEMFTADLVVASDGIKSLARKHVLSSKSDNPMIPTGFAAYRATVDAARMKDDPELSWLIEKPGLNLWIGDMRHVMTYTIAAGHSFNMVLSHPETEDPTTWDQSRALDDMRSHFQGWDPVITKLMKMVNKTMKWPILTASKLDRWVAPSGKCLILGDAAHAMVPYMSQGAAMAVEDGAALAEALDRLASKDDLSRVLKVFERVRMERCSQMQDASLLNGKLWHFADGPEQVARDKAMRPEVEGRHFLHSPNQWSDPTTQLWCYAYDAEEAIARALDA